MVKRSPGGRGHAFGAVACRLFVNAGAPALFFYTQHIACGPTFPRKELGSFEYPVGQPASARVAGIRFYARLPSPLLSGNTAILQSHAAHINGQVTVRVPAAGNDFVFVFF